MSDGYLDSKILTQCYGCEACAQACNKNAITMIEDDEGFRYPHVEAELCVHCGLCRVVCPHSNPPKRFYEEKYAYGGYHKDAGIRAESTSGGAFSAIVDAWCDDNYVIFGAVADGLSVRHEYITDKKMLGKFRKSKYSQSVMGTAYSDARSFLREGKKVLFSGTPCHIAALKSFLRGKLHENLLMVEVVCEGVPSPLYVRKYGSYLQQKYSSTIRNLDYRYTDSSSFQSKDRITSGKWDFEVMRTVLKNGRELKQDRWFNPFWSIWLNHLMSRPSCYECPFAGADRNADITMGDLWGVHIYCPDLYGRNGGSSLVVCNSAQGKTVWQKAQQYMYGRELSFDTAVKYQGPMRSHIASNPLRDTFMSDLKTCDYLTINKKWAKRPTLKLFLQKYVWGNRQKVWLWNILRYLKITSIK